MNQKVTDKLHKKSPKNQITWQKELRAEWSNPINGLLQLHGLWSKKKRTSRDLLEARRRLWGKI